MGVFVRQRASHVSGATVRTGGDHGGPVAMALLVAGCMFMQQLDGTIVTTAAPQIGAALGVSGAAVGLIVTGYMLSLAVFIPAGGWLMTLVPARFLFAGAVALFTLASAGCGLSNSLAMITCFRVIQGIGGAFMVPLGRQLVLRDAPKDQVLKMINYIVWPSLVAPVIAPMLGGVIVSHASWRWLFWLNIPLGAAGLVAALRVMPATVDRPRTRFDGAGFILIGAGLAGVVWTAHLVSDTSTPLAGVLGLLVASLAVCGLAVRHLLRARRPLVDLRVLGDRVFGLSTLGSFAFWMVVFAIPFLLPLMLETSMGWSPLAAGALVMAVFIGNVGIKPAANPLLRIFGFRANLFVGTIGLLATSIGLGVLPADTSWLVLGLVALASGAFRSIAMTGLTSIAFATIDQGSRRAANTLQAMTQQLAAGMGVAVGTVALRVGTAITGTATSHASYSWGFVISGGLALVAVACTACFPRRAGHELT